jgi:perosamine synthetase
MLPWPSPNPKELRFPVARPGVLEEDIEAMVSDLRKGNVSGGSPTIGETEKALSRVVGSECLLVSNGSVAITLALRALDIGAGDEVLVPTLTYAATASSVVNIGAVPVFCDVDSGDWNISFDSILKGYSERTKALILVDLYGVTRDWEPIVSWARSKGLRVIHDCAESLTSTWEGRPTGYSADVRTFSFFANKLITSGEGGAVATSSEDLLDAMRKLRGQGMSENVRYWFDVPGYNFRISSPQASLLLNQIHRIEEIVVARERLFEKYDALLGGVAGRPVPTEGAVFSPWMYTVQLEDIPPRQFAAKLASLGVETRPVFYPLTTMPAFTAYDSAGGFPSAIQIQEKGISLPTWTHWTDSELEELSELLKVSIDECA